MQQPSVQFVYPDLEAHMGFNIQKIIMDKNAGKYPFCIVLEGKFLRQIPMWVTTQVVNRHQLCWIQAFSDIIISTQRYDT